MACKFIVSEEGRNKVGKFFIKDFINGETRKNLEQQWPEQLVLKSGDKTVLWHNDDNGERISDGEQNLIADNEKECIDENEKIEDILLKSQFNIEGIFNSKSTKVELIDSKNLGLLACEDELEEDSEKDEYSSDSDRIPCGDPVEKVKELFEEAYRQPSLNKEQCSLKLERQRRTPRKGFPSNFPSLVDINSSNLPSNPSHANADNPGFISFYNVCVLTEVQFSLLVGQNIARSRPIANSIHSITSIGVPSEKLWPIEDQCTRAPFLPADRYGIFGIPVQPLNFGLVLDRGLFPQLAEQVPCATTYPNVGACMGVLFYNYSKCCPRKSDSRVGYLRMTFLENQVLEPPPHLEETWTRTSNPSGLVGFVVVGLREDTSRWRRRRRLCGDVFSNSLILLGLIAKRVYLKEGMVKFKYKTLDEWAYKVYEPRRSLMHTSLMKDKDYNESDVIALTGPTMRCKQVDNPEERPIMSDVEEVKFLAHPSVNHCPNLEMLIGFCCKALVNGSVYDLNLELAPLEFAMLLEFLHDREWPLNVFNIDSTNMMFDQLLNGGIMGILHFAGRLHIFPRIGGFRCRELKKSEHHKLQN
ncbi:hypothetical protein LguiB_013743 [Lonicera macranthoides]